MKKIFPSSTPILEACMNKGSSLELAVAVHEAGAYASFCSWTYNQRPVSMRQDIQSFVEATGSNHVHLSFELYEFAPQVVYDIIKDFKIPTIEIIYGQANTFAPQPTEQELERDLLKLLQPISELGTKIFRRIYEPMSADMARRHLLDGFCIKGLESAGMGSYTPVRELFLKQKTLTPDLALIPYGGVGTAEQVKDYIDLGAEMVAVGTLFALSQESTIKTETKQAAVNSTSKDLTQFTHEFVKDTDKVLRKQNALQFAPYPGPDDPNRTLGLVQGMWKKNSQTGHVYLGHAIDHVKEIRTCKQIVNDLTSLL